MIEVSSTVRVTTRRAVGRQLLITSLSRILHNANALKIHATAMSELASINTTGCRGSNSKAHAISIKASNVTVQEMTIRTFTHIVEVNYPVAGVKVFFPA